MIQTEGFVLGMNTESKFDVIKNKDLIDPMAIDTEEDLKEKKEKWMDIFQRCPDFADLFIDIFTSKGEDGINELYKFIVQTVKIL